MIRPDQLEEEMKRVLAAYANNVAEEIEKAKKANAQALVKELKQTSPKRKKNGGAYAASWTLKKSGNKYIAYNKKHYRLTHLLEHGHAKIGGGRVAARVHIAPAEHKHVNNYLQDVERAIQRS